MPLQTTPFPLQRNWYYSFRAVFLGKQRRSIIILFCEQVNLLSCKQPAVFVIFAIFLSFGSLAAADEGKSPAKTAPWKPEDVVYAESINDFSLSPNARQVVWVKGEGDKEKDERVSNLFLIRGMDCVSKFASTPECEAGGGGDANLADQHTWRRGLCTDRVGTRSAPGAVAGQRHADL
jgi:hypothetical protein